MKLRLFILIILNLSVAGILQAQQYSYTENNDGSRTFRKGQLIIKEDIPFLTVKGDPYDAGLQYGVLLNDYLLKMDYTVDSLIENYIGSFFLKKWIANIAVGFKIRKIEKVMPDYYSGEFEGMADGSDLSLKDIKKLAYFPQLFFNISCSAFILRNENNMVHGRNLDWPGIEVLTHFPLIVNYHIESKNPVTNLTFIGYPGVYTGMNHKGLSMSINMNGTPAENNKKISDYNIDMPLAFKLRDILETAEDINGVDKMFRGYSSHAWFITVGSKSDHSGAIYELTRGKVIKNEMTDDFLAVANLSLSDVGRYQYSPITMFNQSNISREQKLNELNEKTDNKDLVFKSYQILTNTENHHLSHSPFYGNSINNSITVKSCIMDNTNNDIYFTYGERCAARNKYLKYNINDGNVSIYKEKQEIADEQYFNTRIQYQQWFKQNYNHKDLEDDDYKIIIKQIKTYNLEPAYKYYLLSYYYSKLKDHENAFINAEKYIAEKPDFYHPYLNKFNIMKDRGEYMDAIVALEEMLQTPTITQADIYFAYVNMIKMYDKLLDSETNQLYVNKIEQLADKIRYELDQYFKDEKTLEDIELIEKIESKYAEKE